MRSEDAIRKERRVRAPEDWAALKPDARKVLREALGDAARDRPAAVRFYENEEQWDAVVRAHLRP